MTPDIEKLFKPPSFPAQTVPPVTSILKTMAIAEIDALQVSNTQKFKPRNSVLVPAPFLVGPISSAILSASKGNANVVLLETNAVMTYFNASLVGKNEYNDISSQKCKPLLFWLFAAIQVNNFVKPIQSEGCRSATVLHHENYHGHEIQTLRLQRDLYRHPGPKIFYSITPSVKKLDLSTDSKDEEDAKRKIRVRAQQGQLL